MELDVADLRVSQDEFLASQVFGLNDTISKVR